MWRLRPETFFPASYPLVAAPTVGAPLTEAESMTAARLETRPAAQGAQDALGGAGLLPAAEQAVDRLPGREVRRQGAPLDAVVQDVQDRVHDLSSAVLLRASPSGPRPGRVGQERVEDRPLGVGQIGRITAAAARRLGVVAGEPAAPRFATARASEAD
jgi:hypothetical protein